MEELKLEAFKTVLFILPGIISLRIKAALAISSPSKPLNTVIDGLILTLIDHGVFGALRWACAQWMAEDTLGGLRAFAAELSVSLPGQWRNEFAASGGFSIIFVAVVVGLATGVIRYHGWNFLLLRRFRATNRTGENLVWAEVLTKLPRETYSVVACKDGSRFMGVIDTFSEESGNYEVFLSQAHQVQGDGTLLRIEGEGVLLTRENPIVRVEFWAPANDTGRQGEEEA